VRRGPPNCLRPYTCPMKIYLVGGAVRDSLLGLPVVDHDWVVVGATPQQMTALGFLPVGRDFPVFLHPKTHEEYALARTERKTAPGYRGFVVHAEPTVTLVQDLARRDLTINSIAYYADSTRASAQFPSKPDDIKLNPANLIDPFGGQRDLAGKVLRHVTDAFREDPVRILRVARFAARFPDFSVAPETMQLMRDMVAHGEADHLVAERVWQELSLGLMAEKPSRMLELLVECGALARLLPEIRWHANSGLILDISARMKTPLPVRFACLTQLQADAGLCERLRLPTECRDMSLLLAREYNPVQASGDLDAASLVKLLERCDAFRKPGRFADLLLACECLWRGLEGQPHRPYPQRTRLLAVLQVAQSVATDSVAAHAIATGASGPKVGEMIFDARVQAVAGWIATQ
jgi:tRNA nucleotidyltransferase (CCA-adding enzyme)